MKTRVAIAAATLAAASGAVRADVIPLTVFENHDQVPLAGLNTFIEVAPVAGGVSLTFRNQSTMDAVVTSLYLESTSASQMLLSSPIVTGGPGVAFQTGASPPNPPGSIAAQGGPWSGTLYAFRAGAPIMQNGIGAGEWLTMTFSTGESAETFADAIAGGGFRVVQHLQGGNDGSSMWGTTVPTPGAVLALGAGIVTRRRRRA